MSLFVLSVSKTRAPGHTEGLQLKKRAHRHWSSATQVTMLLLRNCAVCAAPVEDESRVQCAGCDTLYCGTVCQEEHAHACEQIAAAGGAEKVYANTQYEAAAAVAIEGCADLVEAGGTCYICWSGGEGLVRSCACRGESGIVHLSCLVQTAARTPIQIVAGADSKWLRCGVCEHLFDDKVSHALSWAAWREFVRPPAEWPEEHAEVMWKAAQEGAACILTRSLCMIGRHEEALPIAEMYLESLRERQPDERYHPDEQARAAVLEAKQANILGAQGMIVGIMVDLGRLEEAVELQREVFAGCIELDGLEHKDTIYQGSVLVVALLKVNRVAESQELADELLAAAEQFLPEDDQTMMWLESAYYRTVYADDAATVEELSAVVTDLDELRQRSQRVFGAGHSTTAKIQGHLTEAREKLDEARGEPAPPPPPPTPPTPPPQLYDEDELD